MAEALQGVFPAAAAEGLQKFHNDSLPDGWGRLLLDRSAERQGIHRGQLNPLDRLAYVGHHGMGALSYEPERAHVSADAAPLALDRLAEESAIVLTGEHEEVFDELLHLNGSSAGARPKIVVQVSANKRRSFMASKNCSGYAHWMIKFPSSQDAKDVGAIEFAYSLMARAAGIATEEAHLFRTKKNRYFGTKRFDRDGETRIHMHSLGGPIHAHHRSPVLDYDTVLCVTSALTRNIRETEKAYALACFNVLAHNRDDHVKISRICSIRTTRGFWHPPTICFFLTDPAANRACLSWARDEIPAFHSLKRSRKSTGSRKQRRFSPKFRKPLRTGRATPRRQTCPPNPPGWSQTRSRRNACILGCIRSHSSLPIQRIEQRTAAPNSGLRASAICKSAPQRLSETKCMRERRHHRRSTSVDWNKKFRLEFVFSSYAWIVEIVLNAELWPQRDFFLCKRFKDAVECRPDLCIRPNQQKASIVSGLDRSLMQARRQLFGLMVQPYACHVDHGVLAGPALVDPAES